MNELLNLEWFSGDVGGTMAPVINFIGMLASCVISLVGFSIVLSTILKNSMHGLYAVSPKFWDRVYELKTADARANGNSSNWLTKFIGGITSFLLMLLPNVKAMTDFENTQMDAKHYFMKSIPMMCVAIFIGVFIYLGYPAQVAGKFSEAGTYATDMLLANMDPETIVDNIPKQFISVKLQTDKSSNVGDQAVNAVARTAISVLNTRLDQVGDFPKESRQQVALNIEAEVLKQVSNNENSVADYLYNTDKYDMSAEAHVSERGAPPTLRGEGVPGTDGIVVFRHSIPVDNLETGVVTDVSNWYLYWDITFKPKALKVVSGTFDVTLYLDKSAWDIRGDEVAIKLPSGATGNFTASSGTKFKSGDNVFAVKSSSAEEIVLRVSAGSADGISTLSMANGFKYRINNTTCRIKEIKFGAGSSGFKTEDGQTFGFDTDPKELSETSAEAATE